MTIDIRTAFPWVSAIKWLILAALAWSQLALAGHQFEHEAAEPADDCTICVQFDRDDTLIDEPQVSAPPTTADTVSVAIVAVAPTAAPNFFRARASP